MNYQLYAVALVVSVDLLVSRLIELSEHLRGDERGDLGTPVVMMEHGFRVYVLAELGRVIQLELGDHVDQFVHLVRVGVEVHHGVLDLTEIVALLEDAGSEVSGHELLFPVDLFSCLYEWLPLFGVVNDVGDLNIVSPVFNVLNDYLVFRVDGERSRSSFRPGLGNAPGVYHVVLAVLGVRISLTERGTHYQSQIFVAVYESVRVAAVDSFKEILSDCKH